MPLTNKGLLDASLNTPIATSKAIAAALPPAHPALGPSAYPPSPPRAAPRRLPTPSRATLVKGTIALGASAALAGAAPWQPPATTPMTATCAETTDSVLGALLAAERLALTFYYAALTTPALSGALGQAPGSRVASATTRRVGPGGTAHLRAVLDQERRHALFLADLGASSPHTSFYLPAAPFARAGYTSRRGTFLWAMDRLETASIGAYLAAAMRLGTLGHPDLALLAARILGTECEHRALGRAIAGDDPVDNVTLEVSSFACVADATRFLAPYLTGRGLSGPVRRHALPSGDELDRLIGDGGGAL